jgi:hypothetical protein
MRRDGIRRGWEWGEWGHGDGDRDVRVRVGRRYGWIMGIRHGGTKEMGHAEGRWEGGRRVIHWYVLFLKARLCSLFHAQTYSFPSLSTPPLPHSALHLSMMRTII